MTAAGPGRTPVHHRFTAAMSHRTAARRGEVRAPAIVAVAVAAVLHATLPHKLLVEPAWLIPAIDLVLVVPLTLVNPTRLTSETRFSRIGSLALVDVIIVTNLISLGFLVRELTATHPASGRELLVAALQIWLTNMIGFALVYWELDRGGAVARLPASNVEAQRADFWFPQDDADTARAVLPDGAPWIPAFVDYLYLSITNSVAFSPTDTLPLTTRAKLLMAVESLSAMVTFVLVIARAVNVLH
jgi:hypothetical protein